MILSSVFIAVLSLIAVHSISSSLYSDEFLDSYTAQSLNALSLVNQNLDLLAERSETYIRLLSIDTELQSCMRTYLARYDSDVFAKRNLNASVTSTLGGTFAPTSQMLGLCIYYDGDILYLPSGIDEQDVLQILSPEQLEQIHARTLPVWQADLYTVDEHQTRHETLSRNIISLSKKIIDRENGHYLGVMTLLLQETAFSSLYDSTNASYYLVNQKGTIVSSTDKNCLYQPLSGALQLSDAQINELQKNSSIRIQDGQSSFMLTMIHNSTLNWELVLRTDLASFMENRSDTTYTLLIILLFTVICIVIITYLVSAAVTDPIRSLLSIMQKYDGTHPTARVPDTLPGEMGILGASFNQLLDKVEQDIEQISAIQDKQHKSELRIMQEQIRPHFLYNSLQTAISLIQLGYYEESIESLYALSEFYKQCLCSGQEVITLAEELNIIRSYLQIQHTRYMDRFDWSIEVDERLQSIRVPKLILQPLVENAIYHGLKPKQEKGTLLITGYLTGSAITLEIMDTGIGMPRQKAEQLCRGAEASGSFGIRNVIERLQLFFGDRFTFQIDSRENEYTAVIITLQQQTGGPACIR